MPDPQPSPISSAEMQRRKRAVKDLAEGMGFRGRVEYVHGLSQSGGAQFGLGATPASDRLTVTAEAFLRDENPNDFSLTAILAHECGHQIVARHATLKRWLRGELPIASEEVLASLIGSLLVSDVDDHNDLTMKAIYDVLSCGVDRSKAEKVILNLRSVLEAIL